MPESWNHASLLLQACAGPLAVAYVHDQARGASVCVRMVMFRVSARQESHKLYCTLCVPYVSSNTWKCPTARTNGSRVVLSLFRFFVCRSFFFCFVLARETKTE